MLLLSDLAAWEWREGKRIGFSFFFSTTIISIFVSSSGRRCTHSADGRSRGGAAILSPAAQDPGTRRGRGWGAPPAAGWLRQAVTSNVHGAKEANAVPTRGSALFQYLLFSPVPSGKSSIYTAFPPSHLFTTFSRPWFFIPPPTPFRVCTYYLLSYSWYQVIWFLIVGH